MLYFQSPREAERGLPSADTTQTKYGKSWDYLCPDFALQAEEKKENDGFL